MLNIFRLSLLVGLLALLTNTASADDLYVALISAERKSPDKLIEILNKKVPAHEWGNNVSYIIAESKKIARMELDDLALKIFPETAGWHSHAVRSIVKIPKEELKNIFEEE